MKQAGIAFAGIRATIGDFFTDDKFTENWQGAKDAGIFRSAYHMLRPDIDAVAQIAHFESVVGETEDLERWAAELDAWARDQGYDGIDPGG